jgi:hypothetical protein
VAKVFTYSGNPSTNNRDAVRFKCGDTFDNEELSLYDDEIDYLLTQHSSSVLAAAIEACERLANKCASEVDTTNIKLSVKASQRMKQFAETADRLRKELRENSRLAGDLWVGGRTITEVEALDEDDDLVQPFFKRGQDDIRAHIDPSTEEES